MRPWLVEALLPYLGRLGAELLVPDYGVMLSVAFLLSGLLTLRLGLRHRVDMVRGLLGLVGVYLGAVAGAHVLTALARVPEAVQSGRPGVLLAGGMTAYGGFLGGCLGCYLGTRGRGHWAVCDVATPAIGFGTALVRLGCLLGGCDFGQTSSLPWAVRFPVGSPAFDAHFAAGLLGPLSTESLPVHPTQLYEALLGCLCGAVALGYLKRRRGLALDGRVFFTGAALYALGRFAIELVRGDADRGLFFGGSLSTSQLVSLLVLYAAGWKLLALRAPGAAASPPLAPALAGARPDRSDGSDRSAQSGRAHGSSGETTS